MNKEGMGRRGVSKCAGFPGSLDTLRESINNIINIYFREDCMMPLTAQNLGRNLPDTPSALNTLPPHATMPQNSTDPLIPSRTKVGST